MILRKTSIVLVCLVFLIGAFSADAAAYKIKQASAAFGVKDLLSPPSPAFDKIKKVRYKRIVKCKPVRGMGDSYGIFGGGGNCMLPANGGERFEIGAQAMFARINGEARYLVGTTVTTTDMVDLDLNEDLAAPKNETIGTFHIRYRFRPEWSIRYSLMPFEITGSSDANRNIRFGNDNFNANQSVSMKWERNYHRVGLLYDPIRTRKARVGVYGDYVRLDDKYQFIQVDCCSETFSNDLNLAMAGMEFEKCLSTSRNCSTLSLECSAGVAFLDDTLGSDLSTALKYALPMNGGRWGFLKGGYRYVSFKKSVNDNFLWDTTIDGGFVEMGFVF